MKNDIEHAWSKLQEVRDTIRKLKDLEAELTDSIAEAMTSRNETLSTGMVIERSRSLNRKWDGPALIRSVAVQAAQKEISDLGLDFSTGGLDSILGAVVSSLRATLAVSYGRMGELAKIGIDPDEYCEKSYGRWTIRESPLNNNRVTLDEGKVEGAKSPDAA